MARSQHNLKIDKVNEHWEDQYGEYSQTHGASQGVNESALGLLNDSQSKNARSGIKYSKTQRINEQDFTGSAIQRGQDYTKTTEYFNMMICKAIAEGDELAFIKNLEKLTLKRKEDPNDAVAKRDVQLFQGK